MDPDTPKTENDAESEAQARNRRHSFQADHMIEKMNLGVRRALREHKRLGQSIIVWDHKNKKIVEVPAEEIDVPDNDDDLWAIINSQPPEST